MRKHIVALIITATAAIGTTAAIASPCGAELCLFNLSEAKALAECKKEIDDFFSIRRTKHGKFSPSRTYQARSDYLNKCESGNTQEKARILSKYGYILKP